MYIKFEAMQMLFKSDYEKVYLNINSYLRLRLINTWNFKNDYEQCHSVKETLFFFKIHHNG